MGYSEKVETCLKESLLIKGEIIMTMDWTKTYTAEERQELDEFYTPNKIIEEHLALTEKYLGLTPATPIATAFGDNNPYTIVLREHGYKVTEYNRFEDLLASGHNEQFVIDNPPFSTAQNDRTKLEKLGYKYSLLASGTWLPKKHKGGLILFKQPRKYFHRREQVLVTIFHNINDNLYSEYHKEGPSKYKRAFIAVNLGEGIYKNSDIIQSK